MNDPPLPFVGADVHYLHETRGHDPVDLSARVTELHEDRIVTLVLFGDTSMPPSSHRHRVEHDRHAALVGTWHWPEECAR